MKLLFLKNKLQKEYDDFLGKIKNFGSVEGAINSAYKITLMEQILCMFQMMQEDNNPLSQSQIKVIYKKKNSIEYLFGLWMNSDSSFCDGLSEIILTELYYERSAC